MNQNQGINLHGDQVITICGMRGTGKTTLLKFLLRGFDRFIIWDPLGQYSEFEPYRIVPQSGGLQEFENLCQWVWNKRNIVLAVEECERWLGQGVPKGEFTYKCINQGRNVNIGLIAVTRRIARLDKDVFSLSDHCFIFRFFAPNDINYLAEFLGKQQAMKVRTLAKYHFLYSSGDQVVVCPPVSEG